VYFVVTLETKYQFHGKYVANDNEDETIAATVKLSARDVNL